MRAAPDPLTVEPDARVYCPRCGYELTPIPQGQCSECGFGYDHKAIRDVAKRFAGNQLGSYDNAISMALAAILCFGVMVLPEIARLHLGMMLIGVGMFPASKFKFTFPWTPRSFLVVIGAPILGVLVLATEVFDLAGLAFLGLSGLAGFWQKSEWRYLPLSISNEVKNRISFRRLMFRIAFWLAVFAGFCRMASA